MKEKSWFNAFPAAITVTDHDGIIIDMNDQSEEMFQEDGGRTLIGKNVMDCHPQSARPRVQRIYETHESNVYTITKNGKKQLIYQSPYFNDGQFAGVVEMCLLLPENLPHFDRDNP